MKGRRILVQGLGNVGMSLAEKLHAAGARLIVSDIDDAARVRTHKIVPSGRSGKDCILDVKAQETWLVSKFSQRQRRSFPERSEGRQSGFEKPRQSLCAMQPHGSAGFSSLFRAGLTPEGTILWVRTLNRARHDLDAEICAADKVFDAEMDVFAPCALGGVLTDESAAKLTARLICGAANNQLASPEAAEQLRLRGIRYQPDYVVNAGGIISVASEIHKAGPGFRHERLAEISDRIRSIIALSNKSGKTTPQVADEMVAGILAQARARTHEADRKGAA